MRFCTLVVVLLVVLVGSVLSQRSSCWKYGNCNPGTNCENPIDPLTDEERCLSCCNGGFFTWAKWDDGVDDCTNGTDEPQERRKRDSSNSLKSGPVNRCLRPKQECTLDSECCSGTCKNEKCWDERCD